ncbi:uncharacterized protein METZ01_LOCUS205832 [marine metagenome]|uniref:Uncharacterized protein n=1 Tax=marine metagenome TaxID=408172 RepID=A0A382EQL1_9ZZZZ
MTFGILAIASMSGGRTLLGYAYIKRSHTFGPTSCPRISNNSGNPFFIPRSSPQAVLSWATNTSSFAPASTSLCASFTSRPTDVDFRAPFILGITQKVQGALQPSDIFK